VSKGLLYHYFPGKREFYVEAIRASSLHLRQLTEPDPLLPPSARLRAAIDAHLDYSREHRAVYKAIYSGGIIVAPEVGTILEEHRAFVMDRLLKNLDIAKPRPALRVALRSWIRMVEGASLDWTLRPEVPQNELRELLVAAYSALLDKALNASPKTDKSVSEKRRRSASGG
jgi:AcrR family transcriptional regulator